MIEALPTDRQTMMFTATWPESVENLANEFLRKPVKLEIGQTSDLNANKAVEQVK